MGLLRILLRALFRPPRATYTPPPPRKDATVRGPLSGAALPTEERRGYTPTAASAVRQGGVLEGSAWVTDGDTIVIDGITIRLFGIDAPELDHPYGRNARSTLIGLCKGQRVRAEFDGGASHDRPVARCHLRDGRDLSAEMVRAVMALDWPKYSGGVYGALEPPGARERMWRIDARQKGRMPPPGSSG